jgi:hypothetical protein
LSLSLGGSVLTPQFIPRRRLDDDPLARSAPVFIADFLIPPAGGQPPKWQHLSLEWRIDTWAAEWFYGITWGVRAKVWRRRRRVVQRTVNQAVSAIRKLNRIIRKLDETSGAATNPEIMSKLTESLDAHRELILQKLIRDEQLLAFLIRYNSTWEWDGEERTHLDVLPEVLNQVCTEKHMSRDRAYRHVASRVLLVWRTLSKKQDARPLSRQENIALWGKRTDDYHGRLVERLKKIDQRKGQAE